MAEKKKEGGLQILGTGASPSYGVRRGVVVDLEDTISSIRHALEDAKKAAQVSVRRTWLSIGGSHVSVSSSRGVVAVSRADGEISPEDVNRAISAAETFIPKNPNREIIHMIPRDFRVDHEPGIKNPIGMHGVRLEVDTLVIDCSTPFLKNLFKCVEGAGLAIEDYVFSPLAASEVVLSKRQKELGTVLVDIGGGTASFIVFEEGVPIHAGVFPIGGGHITNDVAIGFRTHVDVAEKIKLSYGSCFSQEFTKKDAIRLAEFVEGEEAIFSRKELAEIVEARLKDVLELLQKDLRRINRNQLLPAGVVLVGGSSLLPGVVGLAKREMRLPVELGTFQDLGSEFSPEESLGLATVLGTVRWAENQLAQPSFWGRASRRSQNSFMKWLKSLLP